MNAAIMRDLGDEYLAWLKGNLVVLERGTSQVLSTPFLDPFNDGIEIQLDNRSGQMVLHDGGRTLDNLLDMGVQIEKSERRLAIIQNAIAGCGVSMKNGRLEILATQANRAQRAHFLMTAILRLNDLWMTASPRSVTDFFEVVKEFFDENEVLYTANKSISGKTVEHPIDFIIPLPRGRDRLIKLMPRPTVQAAKLVSFSWIDLQEEQGEAERVVFVNDLVAGDEETLAKPISENVTSILGGYSNRIYAWSEARNDAEFVQKIRAAW